MPSSASLKLTSLKPTRLKPTRPVARAVYGGEGELFAVRGGQIAGFLVLTGVPAAFWSLALVYGMGVEPSAVAAFAFAVASFQAFVWSRLCRAPAIRGRIKI
ncbi:MAG: hypothetical protein AB7K67_08150 [Hyphomicrobiaceae bacterium]